MRSPGQFTRTASPEALFIVGGISQYTGAVIAVELFDEVRPATVTVFRVVSAAIAILLVSIPVERRRGGRPWTRRELGAAAVFGIATALMNLSFYLAIDRLPLGTSVVLEFIGPIIVAAVLTRTRRNTVALLLAAAGVGVLSGVEIGGEPWGLFFIFCASAMWAAYIVVGRHVATLDRGLSGLGVGLAIGSVVILPFGWRGSSEVLGSPSLLVLCVIVGALSSAVGYGIDQAVLRRIPTRRFALLLALLPVIAMTMGLLVLGQTPSLVDLLGAALIIAGVATQSRDTALP